VVELLVTQPARSARLVVVTHDPADWLARAAALARSAYRVPPRGETHEEARMSQGGLTGDDETGAEAGNERNEGRPTGTPKASEADRGRPEPVREDATPERPDTTVAPEEQGEAPETEHAPGSDL
jgi:hypothetical protein